MLQKILRFLDYIIKGSYKAGGNKHIFTDQELYEEYNLTDEEINDVADLIDEYTRITTLRKPEIVKASFILHHPPDT